MLLILTALLAAPAYAFLTLNKTEVYEGEIVVVTLDTEQLEEQLGGEWIASYFSDAGGYIQVSNTEALWIAPLLPANSPGQRVSLYITVEDPDIHRSIAFEEVIVYPLPWHTGGTYNNGCSHSPLVPSYWLIAAAGLYRKRRLSQTC